MNKIIKIFFENRVVKNASWMIISKIAQSVLGLLISMFTARYLGPSNYGLIQYATSVVAFVTPIMMLGLNSILVQELIEHPDEEGEIMGTSLCMSIVSAVLCMCGVATFVSIAQKGKISTIIVCVIYSIILIFQALELIQYWFQSKLLSKYYAITALISYFVVSMYRIFLLILKSSVYWFALSAAFDASIIAIVLIITYWRLGGKRLCFSLKTARRLFNKGKYYIISSMMVSIFANTDRIMINSMLGEEMTGYYSAAFTCANISGFVFAAIIESMRPIIFEGAKNSVQDFERNLAKLYCIIFYLSILQGVFMTILSKPIIYILYGEKFFPAASVLRLIVWYVTFAYLGSIRDIWILSEKKQDILWKINLIGASTNITLNLMFIPIWGIVGAALASLITQIFTNFICGFIFKSIRRNNIIMIKAFNIKNLIRVKK